MFSHGAPVGLKILNLDTKTLLYIGHDGVVVGVALDEVIPGGLEECRHGLSALQHQVAIPLDTYTDVVQDLSCFPLRVHEENMIIDNNNLYWINRHSSHSGKVHYKHSGNNLLGEPIVSPNDSSHKHNLLKKHNQTSVNAPSILQREFYYIVPEAYFPQRISGIKKIVATSIVVATI